MLCVAIFAWHSKLTRIVQPNWEWLQVGHRCILQPRASRCALCNRIRWHVWKLCQVYGIAGACGSGQFLVNIVCAIGLASSWLLLSLRRHTT